MSQFPSDLKEENTIIFSYAQMPSTKQQTIDYSSLRINFNPIGAIALPLPANMEETSTHNYDLTDGLTNKALNAVGDFIAKSASAVSVAKDSLGASLDPHFFQAYINTQPRSFSYNINMIPRNKAEANQIMNIILAFKKYSSPISSGLFLRNHMWAITINNKQLAKATKFDVKMFALASVTTNYTGAGSALFYKDGMPKQINLSINFVEQGTMYENDW